MSSGRAAGGDEQTGGVTQDDIVMATVADLLRELALGAAAAM